MILGITIALFILSLGVLIGFTSGIALARDYEKSVDELRQTYTGTWPYGGE